MAQVYAVETSSERTVAASLTRWVRVFELMKVPVHMELRVEALAEDDEDMVEVGGEEGAEWGQPSYSYSLWFAPKDEAAPGGCRAVDSSMWDCSLCERYPRSQGPLKVCAGTDIMQVL